jgi:hypothetical protein
MSFLDWGNHFLTLLQQSDAPDLRNFANPDKRLYMLIIFSYLDWGFAEGNSPVRQAYVGSQIAPLKERFVRPLAGVLWR